MMVDLGQQVNVSVKGYNAVSDINIITLPVIGNFHYYF